MSSHVSSGAAAASDTNVAEIGGHGGRIASVLSAVALAFSGLSYYESVMKTAALEVYVPPVIHYGRDQGGDVELFAIPITVVNSGARTGTVLTMELEAQNQRPDAEVKSKRYYSAYIGEHAVKDDEINRSFAPLSLAGRTTFSDTVRFYPIGNPLPRLVDDAGDYTFILRVTPALPEGQDWWSKLWSRPPATITFTRTLPWISDQQLGMRRATIAMHDKDWKPAAVAQ